MGIALLATTMAAPIEGTKITPHGTVGARISNLANSAQVTSNVPEKFMNTDEDVLLPRGPVTEFGEREEQHQWTETSEESM